MENFAPIINKIIQGKHLTTSDIQKITTGGLTFSQAGALLTGLIINQPTQQELQLGKKIIIDKPELVVQLPPIVIQTFTQQ